MKADWKLRAAQFSLIFAFAGFLLSAPFLAFAQGATGPGNISITNVWPPTCTTVEIDGTVSGSFTPPIVVTYSPAAGGTETPAPVTMNGANDFTAMVSGLTANSAQYTYTVTDSASNSAVFYSGTFASAPPGGSCGGTGGGGTGGGSATASAVPQDTYADITVNVSGTYSGTSLTIKYGTSATALSSSASAVSNGTAFYGGLTGLTPKTTYYYQAFSSVDNSALMAAPLTFTTTTGAAGGSSQTGTVTSLSVVGVTQTTATVVGSVAKGVTNGVEIMVDKTGNGTFNSPTTPTIGSDRTFTFTITGLKAGMTYHIVAVKSSDTTVKLSNVVGFATLGVSLSSYVSSLADITATISAQAAGADSPTVHYGTNSASMTSTATMVLDSSTPGHYTATISGLTANTAYYYQITSGDGKTLYMYPSGFKTLASGATASTTVPTITDTGTGTTGVTYSGSALVTCGLNGPLSNGNTGTQACGFPEFMALINRIISFLLLLVAPIIATVLILYRGIMILTSGGNTEQLAAAKGALLKVVVGFAIACGAWLLVQFVMKSLGVVSTVFPTFY